MRDFDVMLDQLSEETASTLAEETSADAPRRPSAKPYVPGVVVTSVDHSSAAAGSDPERGDVIQEVNCKLVRNVVEYD